MGYLVDFTGANSLYQSIKPTLVINDDWETGGDASVSVKGVHTIAAGMRARVLTNSATTFGGSVRGWTVRSGRAASPITYDLDFDDWRTYLDRERPCVGYTNIRADSIVLDLLDRHTTFDRSGVHSLVLHTGAVAWPQVSVTYVHSTTLSQAFDELTSLVAATADTYDPVWGITADRIFHWVGNPSSYGTTVTIDDTDADLRGVDIGMVGNEIVTRVWAWAGSATVTSAAGAGATSLCLSDTSWYVGVPGSISGYSNAAVYVGAPGRKLIQVTADANTVSDPNVITISSQNIDGVAHTGYQVGSIVQSVVMQALPVPEVDAMSSITGEKTGYWDLRYNVEMTMATQPAQASSLAYQLLRGPSQSVESVRVWTVNSAAMAGGRLAVSLTAPGVVPGLYTIRRVRIAGFDRGENVAPIYEIEAGAARYRVDSLL